MDSLCRHISAGGERTGRRARGDQYGRRPDGSGRPAKRRDGRGVHGGRPCAQGETQDLTTVVGRFDVGNRKRRETSYRSPVHAAQASIAQGMKASTAGNPGARRHDEDDEQRRAERLGRVLIAAGRCQAFRRQPPLRRAKPEPLRTGRLDDTSPAARKEPRLQAVLNFWPG